MINVALFNAFKQKKMREQQAIIDQLIIEHQDQNERLVLFGSGQVPRYNRTQSFVQSHSR